MGIVNGKWWVVSDQTAGLHDPVSFPLCAMLYALRLTPYASGLATYGSLSLIDSILFQFVLQSAAIDAQDFCGPAPVSPCILQGLKDERSFYFLETDPGWKVQPLYFPIL